MDKLSANAKKLVSNASQWTFEDDCSLLQWMKDISENIETRARTASQSLLDLSVNVSRTSVALDNAANSLTALASHQFVENRVQEDDIHPKSLSEVEGKHETPKQQKSSEETIKTFLNNNMTMLRKCHEKISIDIEASEGEEVEYNCIYQPKNPYNKRLLPHIFGSKPWQEHWHIGLRDTRIDFANDDASEGFSEAGDSEDLCSESIESIAGSTSECDSKHHILSPADRPAAMPSTPLSWANAQSHYLPHSTESSASLSSQNSATSAQKIDVDPFQDFRNPPASAPAPTAIVTARSPVPNTLPVTVAAEATTPSSTPAHASVAVPAVQSPTAEFVPAETLGTQSAATSPLDQQRKLLAEIAQHAQRRTQPVAIVSDEPPPDPQLVAAPTSAQPPKRKPVNLFDDDDFNSFLQEVGAKLPAEMPPTPSVRQSIVSAELPTEEAQAIRVSTSTKEEQKDVNLFSNRGKSPIQERLVAPQELREKKPLNLFESPDSSPTRELPPFLTNTPSFDKTGSAPREKTKISAKSLFDDDGDDDDDFLNVFGTKKIQLPKPMARTSLFNDDIIPELTVPAAKDANKPSIAGKAPLGSIASKSLFDDDSDQESDLFAPIGSVKNTQKPLEASLLPKTNVFAERPSVTTAEERKNDHYEQQTNGSNVAEKIARNFSKTLSSMHKDDTSVEHFAKRSSPVPSDAEQPPPLATPPNKKKKNIFFDDSDNESDLFAPLSSRVHSGQPKADMTAVQVTAEESIRPKVGPRTATASIEASFIKSLPAKSKSPSPVDLPAENPPSEPLLKKKPPLLSKPQLETSATLTQVEKHKNMFLDELNENEGEMKQSVVATEDEDQAFDEFHDKLAALDDQEVIQAEGESGTYPVASGLQDSTEISPIDTSMQEEYPKNIETESDVGHERDPDAASSDSTSKILKAVGEQNYNALFLDEPPDDDDFFQSLTGRKWSASKTTYDVEQDFDDLSLPKVPSTTQQRDSDSMKTALTGPNYSGLQLFSDIPPDDDDEVGFTMNVEASGRNKLQNVFYDDFPETIAAMKSANDQKIPGDGFFNDEPPVDFVSVSSSSSNGVKKEQPHEKLRSIQIEKKDKTEEFTDPSPFEDVTDRGAIANPNKDIATSETLTQFKAENSTKNTATAADKGVSKLQMPKLNINVHALLPNASGKPNYRKSLDAPQDKEDTILDSSKQPDQVSFEQPPQRRSSRELQTTAPTNPSFQANENMLSNVCKGRVRAPAMRRPSTRQGRQESYRKSLLAEQVDRSDGAGISSPTHSFLQSHMTIKNDTSSVQGTQEVATTSTKPKSGAIEGENKISAFADIFSDNERDDEEEFYKSKLQTGPNSTMPTTVVKFSEDDLFPAASDPPLVVKESKKALPLFDAESDEFEDLFSNSTTSSKGAPKKPPELPMLDDDLFPQSNNPQNQGFSDSRTKSITTISTTPLATPSDAKKIAGNLFDDDNEEDDDDLFGTTSIIASTTRRSSNPVTASTPKAIVVNPMADCTTFTSASRMPQSTVTALFDSEQNDSDDDLFKSMANTKPTIEKESSAKVTRPTPNPVTAIVEEVVKKPTASIFDSDDDNEEFLNAALAKVKSAKRVQEPSKNSLFSDMDSDDDGDLFGASKAKSSAPTISSGAAVKPIRSDATSSASLQKTVRPAKATTLQDNPLADLLDA